MYDSGSERASATAYWSGPAETYVRYCFAERTAVISSGPRHPADSPSRTPWYDHAVQGPMC
ncbi:hypothetical protein A4E84_21770 [Streptomyces qaidamensis]|uniref:Uncharacterized protein n=1 Tax=Streptomyces qaidamensis TaxID=1783515 RepID=A0A143C4K9_9ACTN|nr:hypothetical protein A4E84_21770 [Streptomyces qaidamensis]